MALGVLVQCKEEIEIEGYEEKFLEGVNYLLVEENNSLFVINRHHENFEIDKELFKRHFIIK